MLILLIITCSSEIHLDMFTIIFIIIIIIIIPIIISVVILHFVTFILLLYLLLYLSFYSVDALDRVAGCVSEDFAEKVREFIEQVRILNLCY
jgi:hypothetical protein